MKVIFLDVDGVLNSSHSHSISTNEKGWMWDEVSEYHLEKLKRIVDKTDAKIVLSSSWREYHPLLTGDGEVTDGLLKVLLEKFEKFGLSIYDVTPELRLQIRGNEIKQWLDNHSGVSNYVIIDDEYDFRYEQESFVVRTTMTNWLTDELSDLAICILNKNS